ncbi:hypothetical protein [Pseudonocardia sp.]|uniref:hypothetical protein n=1 Tax=Pseudonocardia sp. TaxID=60912 RepID=UPI003D152379
MLKKAGVAVAVAAVGVLALAPFALADTDQDTWQSSTQGEGEANGKNLLSGLDEQLVCNENLDIPSPTPGDQLEQGGGACEHSGTQVDQVETQKKWEH